MSTDEVVKADATENTGSDWKQKYEDREVCWLPLESNPEMLNEFAHRVGMNDIYSFNDVWGLDESLTAMIPRPCFALTLLFKPSDKIRDFKTTQHQEIETGAVKNTVPDGEKLFYLKQYVGNACGTIATIHAIANAEPIRSSLPADSKLATFLNDCKDKDQEERGALLGQAAYLHEASEESASGDTAQTEAPEVGEDVDCHFIVFVENDGNVFELDGCKAFPINHGPTNGDFVNATAKVIQQKFMQTDPESMHWNMMALCEGRLDM